MSKIVLVRYFGQFSLKLYAYKIPLLIFNLKEKDFIIVDANGDKTVARIELIIPYKDFKDVEPNEIKLKYVIKKIKLD